MRTIISHYRRSAPAKKDEQGTSLDELTFDGIDEAGELGRVKYGGTGNPPYGFYSPTNRALHTIHAIIGSAGLTPASVFRWPDPLLRPLEMSEEYKHNALAESKKIADENGKPFYDAFVQYLLDNKDPKGENVRAAAARLAKHALRQASFGLKIDDGKTQLFENITHGLLLEASLIEFAYSDTRKIEDIGGGFNSLEGYTLTFYWPSQEVLWKVKAEYRGKELELDLPNLVELAKECGWDSKNAFIIET